jgi:DNA-binding NarL/FixJ family response regulator
VLRLVAKSLSAKDAAARLGVSPRTVQNHVRNALGKLQLRNRVEFTRFALREGYDEVFGQPAGPDQGQRPEQR